MKKLLATILSAAALTCSGQIKNQMLTTNFTSAASNIVADIASRVIAPYTNIAIQSQSLFDTNVAAFVSATHIVDYGVQTDLQGFAGELKAFNFYTNLVDAVLFHPRFNPTNQLSFKLNAWTSVNPIYTSWAAFFDKTNSINFNLPATVVSNTVVIVWRTPKALDGNYAQNYRANVYSLRASDSSELVMGRPGWKGLCLSEKSSTAWAYNGAMDSSGGDQMTNAFRCMDNGTDGFIQQPLQNRQVFAITSDGHGTHKVWRDTMATKFWPSNAVYFNSWTSPTVCSAQLATLILGIDNEWNTNKPYGTAQTNENFGGEINAVLVFNKVLTTNEINVAYRAVRWLEPEDTEVIWMGDSIVDTYLPTPLVANPLIESNKLYNLWQIQRHPNINCWHQYSRGGADLFTLTNVPGVNTPFPISEITFLPKSKVRNITVFTDLGRNDVLGASISAEETSQRFQSIYNTYAANGATVVFLGTQPLVEGLFTSQVPFNPVLRDYIGCQFTNSAVSRIVDVSLYIGTNDMVTNLGAAFPQLSADGAHLNGTNGQYWNYRYACLLDGLPFGTTNNLPAIAGSGGTITFNQLVFPQTNAPPASGTTVTWILWTNAADGKAYTFPAAAYP